MESMNKYLPANHLHQPSNYHEYLSAHRSLFADGLKDLRNVKEQLYSAAEHFQDSYHKNDQKQMLLESLKDYISKSMLKTVDHLGCVTNKVNKLLDEHVNEVSKTKLLVSGIEQRLRTCQICANYGELSQQSLMMQTPKYYKQYPAQEGCISEANKPKTGPVQSSGLSSMYKNLCRKGYSRQTCTELPSGLITFSLTKDASLKKIEKRSRSVSPLRFSIRCSGSSANQPTCPSFSVKFSASSVHRSISPNPSSSRQQQPPEAMKSQTLYPQRPSRPSTKDMEIYSKKTRNLFKALLSIYKSKNNII
ncbi:protein ABIL2 isoform X2 [Helianthus annuus]|uniref:protein ABIL2 isoform X2 n=1 Tax=Helianthus annuus TaxID=4232 RepID=UPI000B8F8FF0|nr:protein ABIL2 isoform X2 [Helianthus annuus]